MKKVGQAIEDNESQYLHPVYYSYSDLPAVVNLNTY